MTPEELDEELEASNSIESAMKAHSASTSENWSTKSKIKNLNKTNFGSLTFMV